MQKKSTSKSIPIETKALKEEYGSRIHIRGGFSDSIDLVALSAQKQYVEFSDRTRMMISNKLYQTLESFFELRKHTLTDIQYKYAPDKVDYNREGIGYRFVDGKIVKNQGRSV